MPPKIFQLLPEKFNHQFLVVLNHQPRQLKKFGHLIKIINVSVKIGLWHSMFKLTCQIMMNALTLWQPWIVITINKNETWMCNILTVIVRKRCKVEGDTNIINYYDKHDIKFALFNLKPRKQVENNSLSNQ